MDDLSKLTKEHKKVSSSLYNFLKPRIKDFEVLDSESTLNGTRKDSYGIRKSYLINKDLKMMILLEGNSYEIKLPKEITIFTLDKVSTYNNGRTNSNSNRLTNGSEIPIDLSKRENRRLRRKINKRLSVLKSNIKHECDIKSKKKDIKSVEKYLSENKRLNRDIKLGELIEK